MSSSNKHLKISIVWCSVILGVFTLVFVFNPDIWPVAIPLSLLVGAVGLSLSNKSTDESDKRQKEIWSVALKTFYISILIYIVAAIIAGTQDQSGLGPIALFFMFFLVLPFYFGAAQLLASAFIKK